VSEHERTRAALSLAASGDIEPEELRQVQAHLRTCGLCRRESEDLAAIAETLRGIPTPQPRPELIARVRELAESKFAEKEQHHDARLLAPLVAASWVVAWVTWPAVGVSTSWAMSWLHLPEGRVRTALVVYSIVGFLVAFVSAVAVGRRARIKWGGPDEHV
jgi:predicted anti-sigma-YlaC factor YlaD